MFSEYYLQKKFNILPFEPINQDPITLLLSQMFDGINNTHRKQGLRAGLLLHIPNMAHQLAQPIKEDFKSLPPPNKYNVPTQEL